MQESSPCFHHSMKHYKFNSSGFNCRAQTNLSLNLRTYPFSFFYYVSVSVNLQYLLQCIDEMFQWYTLGFCVSSHMLFSCARLKHSLTRVVSHYWLFGTSTLRYCLLFFSSLRCMHLSVHFPGKQRKGTNWWKSSQILALNTIVSRLFQDRMSRLNILKGKQLEWFHLGLCWHYRRSILLLCCVDIGPQSVLHSSCKQYLGDITSLSCVS